MDPTLNAPLKTLLLLLEVVFYHSLCSFLVHGPRVVYLLRHHPRDLNGWRKLNFHWTLQYHRIADLFAVASDLRALLLRIVFGVLRKVAAADACPLLYEYFHVEFVLEGPSAAVHGTAVVALLLGDGASAHEVAMRDRQELSVWEKVICSISSMSYPIVLISHTSSFRQARVKSQDIYNGSHLVTNLRCALFVLKIQQSSECSTLDQNWYLTE